MITAEKIYDVIKKHRMISAGDRVVAGISGGADSMCLLFLISELRERLDFIPEAVHVNHGIRGTDADRDQEYVEEQCERLKIPLRVVRADIPAYSREHSLSEEEAGRIVRYQAFRAGAPERIAVAHHSQDSAETVLFNLFRGSGIKGISGISPVSGDIIRPLLFCSRDDIEEYCRIKGIKFREDATNRDTSYARNRIRHIIIPEARKINSAAVKHITEFSSKAAEAFEFIGTETDKAFMRYADTSKMPDSISLDIACIEETAPIIRELLIKKCICTLSGREKDISSVHIRDTEKAARGISGHTLDLPYGIKVKRSFDKLLFIKRATVCNVCEIPFCIKEGDREIRAELPDGSLVTGELTSVPDNIPDLPYTKWLDYDKIGDGVFWRVRKPGDRIGIKNGSKKLKDLFIEEKLPALERDSYYFLAAGNEAVWVPGMRIGHGFKITEETKRVLKVTLNRKETDNGRQD